MYTFWQTVLLDEHTYFDSPFVPHAKLDVKQEHFDRWLLLFNQTVNENFYGKNADGAKWRGRRMAEMFYSKIKYYQKNLIIPIL